ncbi:MAG: DUF4338 domain-containing protein [Planctomycetaceae bacterium]|nr:DUF4338 domain-containing protein [Planctomycetaceae bacterium]
MKDLEEQSSWGAAEPSPELLKELEVRPALPGEMERVRRLLDDEHYLGAGRAVGRTLVQIVHHRGGWAALLVWGPAAVKLLDRDEWVGWTHPQRAGRLGLLVQNRRFLVLADARMPNLASRSLALAVRHLPEHWESLWGYRPLLAETFTDIEAFEGTCYKAAGWEPCGLTKGFGRHRADFYREHDRPKKLWLKALSRNARVILRATDLPAAYRPGMEARSAERTLPLKRREIDSLREALREVPDPRSANRCWPISVLLSLVCVALLAGRRNLAEIHRFGQFLTQQQRGWLGFLPKKGGVGGRRAPSYQALYNLLRQLDPELLATVLNRWLERSRGNLPHALALDGKYVRDLVLTLGLSEHGSGAPAAMLIASREPKSEQAKTEGETTAAKRLYRGVTLSGATVTGDALHCEREGMQRVVEAGGDFLFQLKANQPRALERAEAIAAVQPPLFPAAPPTPGTDGSSSGT